MTDKPAIPTPAFQTEPIEPTPQELADQFAKQAVKTALAPEPDGLNLLDELARIIPKSKG
jgi:hypothetical protein